ncbi:Selenoprotein [Plasmodium coatneyi]|uniref:Selenoprotein n=1 Tax=Plasmodium coatneyi TaxID=208452 RepID=A0A1B1DYC0_9APIC|nr:Selenoprotein [Plasmodium coatneyi]ANQ07585.1 Selenoprotein [Plasmodium coatneyi]
MYYLKLFLKLLLLLFLSYDFIILKNGTGKVVHGDRNFLKESYEFLFVQKDTLPSYINRDNQISIYFCKS